MSHNPAYPQPNRLTPPRARSSTINHESQIRAQILPQSQEPRNKQVEHVETRSTFSEPQYHAQPNQGGSIFKSSFLSPHHSLNDRNLPNNLSNNTAPSNNLANPEPNQSTLVTHPSTPHVLVYTISTGKFRTEHPSILLREPSRTSKLRSSLSPSASNRHSQHVLDAKAHEEDKENSKKQDLAKKTAEEEAERQRLNTAYTLLSPTIHAPGTSSSSFIDTEISTTGKSARLSHSFRRIKLLISNPTLSPNPHPTASVRSPKSPPPKEPKTTSITNYAATNPPLLSHPTNFMIIPLPRWRREFEFVWRTRCYGMSEEEKKRGGSVLYKRVQKLPGWVWVGRNLGVEFGNGGGKEGVMQVGEKWAEVWVERGK